MANIVPCVGKIVQYSISYYQDIVESVSVQVSFCSSSLFTMGTKAEDRIFISEFIDVYHSLPALWDVKSKDYSNRFKKNEQYDQLLEKYRENFPNADKQEVIKKINALRTNFRKELKRIHDAEKSGAGAEDVEPSLWYFEEMKFLMPQETPTASTSTMEIAEVSVRKGNEDGGTDKRTISQDNVSNSFFIRTINQYNR